MNRVPGKEERQRLEIQFWRDARHESPESDSVHNLVNKLADARVYLECLNRHRHRLTTRGEVLELGSGQGWSACIYKKLFPATRVIATDISEHAVRSLSKWERVFGVELDDSHACECSATGAEDASLDLVFCFAAAHHFMVDEAALREIARILKPDGCAIFFYEPVVPRIWYRPIRWLVNRRRSEVPEDLLVPASLRRLARKSGLKLEVDYHPSLLRRTAPGVVYFSLLRLLPFLQPLLPGSANLILTKRR